MATMKIIITLLAFIIPLSAKNISQNPIVILITLDGVRWQEFFNGSDPLLNKDVSQSYLGNSFPIFWKKHAQNSTIFGHRESKSPMTVDGTPVSLPGYKSIFLGHDHDCNDNNCGRVLTETFPERIARELKLNKYQVAGFSSWGKIELALEHDPGNIFVNTNITDVDDETVDSVIDSLNALQKLDPPKGWGGARRDIYTWAQGMYYLQKHQPRFLYIGLDDSDEYGHLNQYEKYLATLHQYDKWIDELITQLKSMGDYGINTTIIITTDHGRGKGKKWTGHADFSWNPHIFTGKHIWCAMLGNQVKPLGIVKKVKGKSHQSIRPTIELLFGLIPEHPEKALFEAFPYLK